MQAATQLTPQTLLRERFGFSEFRPRQAEVIGHLLAGRSSLAIFPTGSGKTLCHQLPALLLDGLMLAVSPLIALMKDQTYFLRTRGIEAARLDSGVSVEAFNEIQDALRERRCARDRNRPHADVLLQR
jgi:ATP-dependent DNA helicase RecQ